MFYLSHFHGILGMFSRNVFPWIILPFSNNNIFGGYVLNHFSACKISSIPWNIEGLFERYDASKYAWGSLFQYSIIPNIFLTFPISTLTATGQMALVGRHGPGQRREFHLGVIRSSICLHQLVSWGSRGFYFTKLHFLGIWKHKPVDRCRMRYNLRYCNSLRSSVPM